MTTFETHLSRSGQALHDVVASHSRQAADTSFDLQQQKVQSCFLKQKMFRRNCFEEVTRDGNCQTVISQEVRI